MKERELRQHAACSLCRKNFGNYGLCFYRVTIERFAVKLDAVRRQAGLEMMLGSVALAQVMGTNADLAIPVMDPLVLVICDKCSMAESYPVAALAECTSAVERADVDETGS